MSHSEDRLTAMERENHLLRARVAELERQRDEAARELRREHEDFRLIFDSEPAMIWFKDTENRILRVNAKAAAASGMTVAEIEGRSTYELFPEHAAAYHQDDLEVIRSNRPKLGIVEQIVTSTGERRWISTDKFPCRDAHGAPIGVVVFAVDITATKQAREALLASEKRYRELVETAHDLICALDRDGRFTFVNRSAAKRILDREPEELVGRHFAEIVDAGHVAADEDTFAGLLQGRAAFDYESTALRKDGSKADVLANAVPMRDESGRVIGVTATCKDITERKRADAERSAMDARLLQTQKLESLGVLAGGIAHDFNNLLVGMLGNAELALSELPPESPARQSIEGVRKAAQRAAELARQMLAYSGRGKFVIERLDLSRLVEETTHLLSAVVSKTAVLRINTAPNLPAIEGDATQIRQVIMNLITNASDAIGERSGFISVTTGVMYADRAYLDSTYVRDGLREGYYVFVEVADTGCGMDAETVARIFEPFYTTKFTGRGLGMAAVLGIVRGHKGAIRVYSELGRGSTIKFMVPALETPAEALAHSGAPVAPAPSNWRPGGAVLVVDDEEVVRAVTKSILERAGVEVLTAVDGRTGNELYRQQHARIAVVLLDMTMPHLDGEQTFRELRRIDPNVRVVLTSGYSEQDATERFTGRGLAGFVRKPCTPSEMLDALRAATKR